MAPGQSAQQVQGLHVLAVVKAARALAAKIASGGGVERVNLAAIREALAKLVEHADRLTNYERQAVARGELAAATDGKAVADILAAASHLLTATREQHDAMNMSEEQARAAFTLDAEPEPDAENASGDDASMFRLD